jgi:hypothetical protein
MHPSYYCPPGIDRPAHIKQRHGVPRQRGPDGLEGTVYGRPYDPMTDMWTQTDAGWYVCLDGVEPRDLMRVNSMPGITVGQWVVPHLMRLDLTPVVGHFGPGGLIVPRHIAPIIERLRAVECTGAVEFAHAQLAADILALNYHVSMHEIGLAEWLPLYQVWELLDAAVGCTREQRTELERVIQAAEAARG